VSWQPAATTGPVGCAAPGGGAGRAEGDSAADAFALCRCAFREGDGEADGDGVADAVAARDGDLSAAGREAGAVPQAQATIAVSSRAAATRRVTGTRAARRTFWRRCVAPGRRSPALPPAGAFCDATSTGESFPILAR
jgi:hypothetical protein